MSSNLHHNKLVRTFKDSIDFALQIISETNDLVDIDSIIFSDEVDLKTLQKFRTKFSQSVIDCLSAKDELSDSYDSFSLFCNDLHANTKVVKEFKQICEENKVVELVNSVKTRLRVLERNKIGITDALNDEKERVCNLAQNKIKISSSANTNLISSQSDNIILSPVSLQSFDGTPEKFLEYITIFDELVHNNSKMSNLKKAVYLKNSLSGSAAMKINGIPAIGSNYQRMYDILRRKFDNIPVNQNSIVQKLENLPPAECFADSCTRTLDQITSFVNQICSSGLNILHSNDPLWLRLIYRKFPAEIVEKIMIENCRETMFCVENLIDELENAIFAKSFLENNKISENSTIPQNMGVSLKQKFQSSYNNYNSHSSCCILCAGHHPARKCLNVSNPEEILNVLRQKRACWKCFEVGHSSFDCQEPDCVCGRKHNVKLCHKTVTGNFNSSYPKVNHLCEHIPVSKEHSTSEDEIADVVVQHSIKETPKYDRIALMTIEAEILNEESKEHEKVTVFFDNGSQGTFVSENLIEKLKIPVNSENQISLVGVNGVPERFLSKSVSLKLKTKSGDDIILAAQSKHTITAGFKAPILLPYDKVWLRGSNVKLNLAKYSGEFVKPDILIGLDNYSEFVLNERLESLPSGYMLADTILGKTIYGNCKNLKNTDFVGCCIRIIQDKADLDMAMIGLDHRPRGRDLSSGPKLVDRSCHADSSSLQICQCCRRPNQQQQQPIRASSTPCHSTRSPLCQVPINQART